MQVYQHFEASSSDSPLTPFSGSVPLANVRDTVHDVALSDIDVDGKENDKIFFFTARTTGAPLGTLVTGVDYFLEFDFDLDAAFGIQFEKIFAMSAVYGTTAEQIDQNIRVKRCFVSNSNFTGKVYVKVILEFLTAPAGNENLTVTGFGFKPEPFNPS